MPGELSTFRVEKIFELTGRGGVIMGSILSGVLRIGQRASVAATDGERLTLEIKSIEYVDDIVSRTTRLGLFLKDGPAVSLLDARIPQGSVLAFL